jgi:hypothetical protein
MKQYKKHSKYKYTYQQNTPPPPPHTHTHIKQEVKRTTAQDTHQMK